MCCVDGLSVCCVDRIGSHTYVRTYIRTYIHTYVRTYESHSLSFFFTSFPYVVRMSLTLLLAVI